MNPWGSRRSLPLYSFLSASQSGTPPKPNQLLLVTQSTPPKQVKFCSQNLSYHGNRQTYKSKNLLGGSTNHVLSNIVAMQQRRRQTATTIKYCYDCKLPGIHSTKTKKWQSCSVAPSIRTMLGWLNFAMRSISCFTVSITFSCSASVLRHNEICTQANTTFTDFNTLHDFSY